MKKVNFLLPMKGHSERVPNKNLKLFVDKPLFHSVLNEILKSRFIDKVYIDTDSEAITSNVNKYFSEVKIIKRPDELIGDHVSMNKIIYHDMNIIGGTYFLQTHSTNPLLKVETLDRAIDFFLNTDHNYDSVFSVTKRQSRFYWPDNKPVNHNPQELIRTQDLSPLYEENSNFYIFTRESFEKANQKRIGNNPCMFVMDAMEAIDIDTESDFLMAQELYKVKMLNNGIS